MFDNRLLADSRPTDAAIAFLKDSVAQANKAIRDAGGNRDAPLFVPRKMDPELAKRLEHFVDENQRMAAYLQEDSEMLTCRDLVRRSKKRQYTHWLHLGEDSHIWASRRQ